MTLTADAPAVTDDEQPKTFNTYNPTTGDIYATYPIDDIAAVHAAVDRARRAADWWAGLGFKGRSKYLDQWRAVLARRMNQLADVVYAETGKPHGDAALEIGMAIEHLAWASKHAKKVLGKRHVSSGLVMVNQRATVEYLPRGVVGVIGPWNYPVFTPMGSIAYALAAGNTVVFKPSEFSPAIGTWLVDAFHEVLPDHDVLQIVRGFGETGNALCTSGVDKLAFTGSTRTGKKVMAACAQTLTPVVIEAGGKDSIIVDADADVDKAAEAAAWGAFWNAGQTCIGIERAYVHEKVYDRFVDKLVEQAESVEPGVDYGPMTMPAQVDVIRKHIADAIARGGRALTGGEVTDGFIPATVLVDVPEDALAVTDETFGPTITVRKVKSAQEAIDLTNASEYGLGSAVFSKKNGTRIADKVRSGMTAVNAVLVYAAIPSLPFGGVGQSGIGRIHGEDGLREFAQPKSVVKQLMPAALNVTSFDRGPTEDKLWGSLILTLHGRANQFLKKK